MRKTRGTGSIFGLLLAATLSAPAMAADTVNFALNWIPYGLHFGPVAAAELGYYKESGIDITISRGFGSNDTLKRVATGANPFGMSDASSVVAGAGKGTSVKMIAVVLDKGVDAVYYTEKTGITTPKDLEGHSLGATAGEAPLNLFPAFAGRAGFDAKKVEVINMTPPAKTPSLMAGQVDSIVAFTTEEPVFQNAAKEAGRKLGRFVYSDYGVDRYSIAIITTDKLIEDNPDLVRRFVNATMRGYAWAMANPEKAADMFAKRYPESTRELMLAQFKVAAEYMVTERTRQHGLGYIDQQKMTETIQLLAKFAGADSSIQPDQVYTTKFLDKIEVPKGATAN